ncbi:uncharacterized protein B0H18DRAFT_885304 [Fomitopsis serialis]|uniref:uncharacterized protein n=1 Tax=Fomitopsis serialis TaxID=139415 RepID=UPI002007B7F9|nr:uncharacterized protein B0H18DRAFT_885304 [Neoantrodia serialis]KAH9916006.1 hypothetical protein B0H18DRAFT_885304 [Neoantrodia serialis]
MSVYVYIITQVLSSHLTNCLIDIQPSHPGKMVQAGLNGGPRHARVLGWAKSYTKDLGKTEREDHDADVIGAAGIAWRLIKSAAPYEVVKHVEQCLLNEGMPHMATQNISEGAGFTIKADSVEYKFPNIERSPPEVYMSCGYAA